MVGFNLMVLIIAALAFIVVYAVSIMGSRCVMAGYGRYRRILKDAYYLN